jgi:hypothetical protein
VDLALKFTWLASTAIAVLLGAVLAWRALAGTDITDAVIRPSASPPPWRRSRWPRA